MAFQTITYDNKVDLNTTQVADINKVNASDMNEIKTSVNGLANHIGKTLWEGSFATGTITVSGISDYSMICIYVGNVMMIGNQRYGGTVFRTYRLMTTQTYVYRYTYSDTNETLTIDTDNPGATDGTNNLTITKIVGVF